MSFVPHDITRPIDATGLSNPGFDIFRAVSDARQAALPTVRMLRALATREIHAAHINALTHFLGATGADEEQIAARPVRFFDLSDEANALTETMNSLFTRGFQPMLSPLPVKPWSSVQPTPHDEDNME